MPLSKICLLDFRTVPDSVVCFVFDFIDHYHQQQYTYIY